MTLNRSTECCYDEYRRGDAIFFSAFCLWNSAFLTFSCIIEGAYKKVLQFFMPLEPIYNKNFCFNEQKWLSWLSEGLNNKKIIKITLFLF
jgi:hypothetical protein